MLRLLRTSLQGLNPRSACAAALIVLLLPAIALAQISPRITRQVDDSEVVVLKGNTHPLAEKTFDRGPVEDSLSGKMLLVLKRSPQQEKELQQLVHEQTTADSPNFHKWLTPEEFGRQFGVAEADIDTVSRYLTDHGFTVGRVYKNRMAIEVSGTAGQLRDTFHTEIHNYSIHGQDFYANSSDPSIPAALAPVVSGFASLNNIRTTASPEGPASQVQASFDPKLHKFKPNYTGTYGSTTFYYVAPSDLQKIYNIPVASSTLGAGGSGITVGVVGDSQINVNLISRYQVVSGGTSIPPTVIVDGNDPAITADANIAYAQLELISAAAPSASLNYYVAATTDYDTGLDFAMIRAVNDNNISVLAIGFQTCEATLGNGLNVFVNQLWLQAAAQGITVVAAAGDSGSAACDPPTGTYTTHGLAVNGYASTPYDTAVGGTDFYYSPGTGATYWSTSNSSTYESALGYIQEQAWDDSYQHTDSNSGTMIVNAGGGGFSTVGSVSYDGTTNSPYASPSWQTGFVPAGTKARAIPDVSFFAGNNYNSAEYAICALPTDCLVAGTILTGVTLTGGTAAAAGVFAGIMAEVVQKYGLQGNANPALYGLYPTNFSSSPTSTTAIFHDVINGTNSVSCSSGTPGGCNSSYLENPGPPVVYSYTAGAGYDEATGLGSVNASNLITSWNVPSTQASTTSLKITNFNTGATVTTAVHGTPLNLSATVTSASAGTPTGNVVFETGSILPSYAAIIAAPLNSSAVALAPYNYFLPGGSYNVSARYAGDSTFNPSDSLNNPNTVSQAFTVTPEPSLTFIYSSSPVSGTSQVFGSPVNLTVEPFSLNGSNVSTPTGALSVFSNNNNYPFLLMPLSSEGTATFSSTLLAGSQTYSLTFDYSGDPSYQPSNDSSTPYQVTVTQAPTSLSLTSTGSLSTSTPVGLTATVVPTSALALATGVPPTGFVTFTNSAGGSQNVNLTSGFNPAGQAIGEATISVPSAQTQSQVSLSSVANLEGIVTDGTTFSSSGGLDGSGNSYSSNLLGTSLTYAGATFNFGTANQSNVVDGYNAPAITLPSGTFTNLNLLGSAVYGNQTGQVFTVTYSDGTTQQFTQSISDWGSPQNYTGETSASTMAYRDTYNGTKSNTTFYLYGYSFALNSAKTVKSLTLPNNVHVTVSAITLTNNPAQSYAVTYNGDANYSTSTQSTTIGANTNAYPGTSGLSISLNSNSVEANGTLIVNATATQSSGTPTGTVQVFANGVSIGSFTITSGSQTAWTVPLTNGYLPFASGSVNLTAVFTPSSTNYAPSSAAATVTVLDNRTTADFGISTDVATQIISPSSSIVYFQVQLTSIANFAGSATPIGLTCAVPGSSNLRCYLETSSTTLNTSGIATVTMAVEGYPTISNGALMPVAPASHWWLIGSGSAMACVFLFGIPARRKGWQGIVTMSICFMLITLLITGCSSNLAMHDAAQQPGGSGSTGTGSNAGASSTPTAGLATNDVAPGTYKIVITGTANTNTTLVHNTQVTVVVTTTPTLANGTYAVENLSSSAFMTYKSNTTQLGLYTADGASDQKFAFVYQNNGYYTIQSVASGLYVTDPGSSNNTTATLAAATNDNTQLWTFQPLQGGYEIVSASANPANSVLDDDGFGTGQGTPVLVYPQKDASQGVNQTWYIQ